MLRYYNFSLSQQSGLKNISYKVEMVNYMDKKIVVALKAIILSNSKALIIRRSLDDEIGAGTWEFVGGKIEFGETLEEAIKREVMEETSLEISVGELLYAVTFKTNPDRQVVILTYACELVGNADVTLSNEHLSFKWAYRASLEELLEKTILCDLDKNHVFDKVNIE